jgi:hypothetical protein
MHYQNYRKPEDQQERRKEIFQGLYHEKSDTSSVFEMDIKDKRRLLLAIHKLKSYFLNLEEI